MNKKLSIAECKRKLEITGFSFGPVLFDGKPMGRFVTHGHRSDRARTVYASRIYSPFKIEVEASSKSALIDKIAREISRKSVEQASSLIEWKKISITL